MQCRVQVLYTSGVPKARNTRLHSVCVVVGLGGRVIV